MNFEEIACLKDFIGGDEQVAVKKKEKNEMEGKNVKLVGWSKLS